MTTSLLIELDSHIRNEIELACFCTKRYMIILTMLLQNPFSVNSEFYSTRQEF